jgi:hypothetical protein
VSLAFEDKVWWFRTPRSADSVCNRFPRLKAGQKHRRSVPACLAWQGNDGKAMGELEGLVVSKRGFGIDLTLKKNVAVWNLWIWELVQP